MVGAYGRGLIGDLVTTTTTTTTTTTITITNLINNNNNNRRFRGKQRKIIEENDRGK